MGQSKRVRRGVAGWRKLFSRQSRSGLSVSEFCGREGINAGLFRRWQARLRDSRPEAPLAMPVKPGATDLRPFIELGDLRSGSARLEVRLDLGEGLVLSIARG
jgi:transposase-like protein